MTADLSAVPEWVGVGVGERVTVPLPSFAGSGNTWSCTGYDEGVVHASIEIAAPQASQPGDGTTEPPAMELASVHLTLVGASAGTTTVRLVLARSFAPLPPTAEHTITVAVNEGAASPS